MRVLSLLALALLSSCGEEQVVDCRSNLTAKTARCLDENMSKGERGMLLACLPFSEPVKTSGLWVIGFEKNDFFEGKRPITGSIITQDSDTELVWDEDLRSKAPYDALEVEVTGRRSLCEFTKVTPHLIVAENLKVKSRRALVAR